MKNILTTHVLVVLNLLIFVLMLLFGGTAELGSFSTHTLLVFGADYTPLVKLGQWYRPLASMFIHLNIIHLVMNMMALFQVGLPLERLYGRPMFTLLYLVAGLAGAAVSLLWYAKDPVVSAGASGAITGLIGAAAVASHRAGPEGARLRNVMLRWLFLVFAYGFMAKADNAAHFGGLVGGALLALAMRPPAGRSLFAQPASERRLRLVGSERRAGGTDAGPGIETFALVAIVAGTFGFAVHKKAEALSAPELVNKGVEEAKAGRDDEAIALYQRAITMEPKDATAHYDLGLALGRKKDHEGAVAALTKAIELGGVDDPKDAAAGTPPKAPGKLDQATSALADEHQRYARQLLDEEKLDEAAKALETALGIDARDPETHALQAHVLSKRGDHAGAEAKLRVALELAPERSYPQDDLKKQLAAALTNRGVALARKDNRKDAIPLYREAVTLDPEDSIAYFDLGIALYHEKDLPGAKAALERSIALAPRKGAYEVLSSVYEELGEDAHSAEAAEKAKTAPETP